MIHRYRSIRFSGTEVGFEIPRILATSDIALRLLHTRFDHISPLPTVTASVDTFDEPVKEEVPLEEAAASQEGEAEAEAEVEAEAEAETIQEAEAEAEAESPADELGSALGEEVELEAEVEAQVEPAPLVPIVSPWDFVGNDWQMEVWRRVCIIWGVGMVQSGPFSDFLQEDLEKNLSLCFPCGQ